MGKQMTTGAQGAGLDWFQRGGMVSPSFFCGIGAIPFGLMTHAIQYILKWRDGPSPLFAANG
jgi:hypothetical protein